MVNLISICFGVVLLLTGTQGFVVRSGITPTRYGRNGHPARRTVGPSPSGSSSSFTTPTTPTTSTVTELFAKATYKNFEDMLSQEPGALLVDFYATWCGPCKMMAEILNEVGPKMQDEVKIFKIDSDKYPALMTKFGVNGLPTLVLFRYGKEVDRIEGVLPADPLMQQVRYWLSESEVPNSGAGYASQGSACTPPLAEQDACAPPSAGDACAPPSARDACAPPPVVGAGDACAPPPAAGAGDACAPPPSAAAGDACAPPAAS